MNVQALNKELGNIDIYLLDQILKARYSNQDRILDAGCGEGRNLVYFLNNQFKVYGIDKNQAALQMLKFVARSIDPQFDESQISTGYLDQLPYTDQYFHHIICTAVLHFAEDMRHFHAMIKELVRVLKPGGSIFIRMASNIGLENKVIPQNSDQYQVPDGSIRFLLTKKLLKEIMETHHLDFLEPLQTVNVNDQHCQSNLLLKRQNT
ncbi:class I SAM-dependent methyltransferase [Fulvivirgaceae bacterium BMA12]|uniref:Class I SAM-dependent methyltransferase n=1 Tax=Agaribacillus aureus TaxID=3051825 RepID=A0ABT8LDV6_9BACT|nr:class I SAM-dependent methyltransferase [Fulvivirgaceae bacterium BMA12]